MERPIERIEPVLTPLEELEALPYALGEELFLSNRDRPLIIGHKGMKCEFPENTLGAFLNALEVGADAVECDVRLAYDDTIFICHEPFLEGIKAEELDQAGRREAGLATLDELMTIMEDWPDRGVVIEAKTYPAARAVLNSYYPTERRSLISFSDQAINLALDEGWSTGYLEARHKEALRDLTPSGAFYGPSHLWAQELEDQELTESMVWTVNEEKLAQELAERKVWALITDYPDKLLALFKD